MHEHGKRCGRWIALMLISMLSVITTAHADHQPLSNNQDVMAFLKAMDLKYMNDFVVRFTGTPELYSKFRIVISFSSRQANHQRPSACHCSWGH